MRVGVALRMRVRVAARTWVASRTSQPVASGRRGTRSARRGSESEARTRAEATRAEAVRVRVRAGASFGRGDGAARVAASAHSPTTTPSLSSSDWAPLSSSTSTVASLGRARFVGAGLLLEPFERPCLTVVAASCLAPTWAPLPSPLLRVSCPFVSRTRPARLRSLCPFPVCREDDKLRSCISQKQSESTKLVIFFAYRLSSRGRRSRGRCCDTPL